MLLTVMSWIEQGKGGLLLSQEAVNVVGVRCGTWVWEDSGPSLFVFPGRGGDYIAL